MKKLNSLAAYSRIKEHYAKAHKISKKVLPYIMALTNAVNDQMAYDYLQADIRYEWFLHVIMHP